MQKVITKKHGRYKVSFAHWSKTKRVLLGIFLASAIFFTGWLVYRDQPMPAWFERYIWNNIVYIVLGVAAIRLGVSMVKNNKQRG